MLVLVLADNLLLLYLGWEGVGLCSYLLIGFWYKDPANGTRGAQGLHRHARRRHRAGRRAVPALHAAGHARHPAAAWRRRQRSGRPAPALAVAAAAAAAGRRGGQVGAAAAADLAARRHGRPDAGQRADPRRHHGHRRRLPDRAHPRALRRWPRRCAWRWPSSAPSTLLLAGFSALAQHDIKRVLAYSTISQIGYMFLALGRRRLARGDLPLHDPRLLQGPAVPRRGRGDRGAAPRARHVQDGRPAAQAAARRSGPSSSAPPRSSALPLVTAGFYSKDLILETSLGAVDGNAWLWLGGAGGRAAHLALRLPAGLPRLLRRRSRRRSTRRPRWRMQLPLVVLAVLSRGRRVRLAAGLAGRLPPVRRLPRHALCRRRETVADSVAYTGVAPRCSRRWSPSSASRWPRCGWSSAGPRSRASPRGPRRTPCSASGSAAGASTGSTSASSSSPVMWFARVNRDDLVDPRSTGHRLAQPAGLARCSARTQNGQLRWYVGVAGVGLAVIVGFVVLR